MALLAAIISLLILAAVANRILQSVVSYWVYFCMVIPGIIVHELSHIVGAVISGADVYHVKLISRTGGEVHHGQPRLPLIGQFLISFAPLLIGSALSYAIIYRLFITVGGNFWTIISAWKIIDWILLYILISLILTFTPSKQDVRSAIWSLIIIIPLIIAITYNPSINISPAVLPAILWLNLAVGILIGILTLFKLIATIKQKT